jgi:microcystin-dependent protein
LLVQSFPVGSIVQFAGDEAPDGWLICNGQRVDGNLYRDLYRILGLKYTLRDLYPPRRDCEFCLPDLRGRVTVGFDPAASLVSNSNVLGNTGGEAQHTLTINEIPNHDHAIQVSPKTQLGGQYPGDIIVPRTEPRSSTTSTTDKSGGGNPHNNMQPYLVLNYIIKANVDSVHERLEALEAQIRGLVTGKQGARKATDAVLLLPRDK